MMINDNEEEAFKDDFPPPPAFYRLYHPTKSEYIPPEPPKPVPRGETYISFGETLTSFNEFNPIKSGFETVKKLYGDKPLDSIDHVAELKKLNRSLLYNYLELLDLLIEHPTLQVNETEDISTITNFDGSKTIVKFCWELKLHQIELIFINMSFLLNYYRPHQAREQMITILQNQLKRRKEVTESVGDCIQYCHKVLKEAQMTLTSINLQEDVFLKTVASEPAASSVLENDSSMTDFYMGQSNPSKRKREDGMQDEDQTLTSFTHDLNGFGSTSGRQHDKKHKDTNVSVVDINDEIMQEFFQ
ncbi:predicted protein [Naegleria gruberi]|uniref:Mediator of RNA polymerase II transcription subunit 7 n=1 Tax=Naegleria gruberi TaxID=5762 RepID=D2VC98_NAEGR|nr:uncharacterized protein NAEGRDRAFT_66495 [Naegleria gruberi]EFC45616.1 predicted protein [Naegleria gruberi]|eukprot:XP_002678360.1 predicted protein [Naegleria gruberi strain NEG-M]